MASVSVIKRQMLVPLIVVFALIVVGITVFNYQAEQTARNRIFDNALREVDALFHLLLEQDVVTMVSLIDSILINQEIVSALENRDRDHLFSLAAPIFAALEWPHGITHFYFHGADRVNLLRVHQPNRYGDRIGRFTMLESERARATASGIELGPLGTFTLRVVVPVTVRDRLVGYVELGKEIEGLLSRITDITELRLYLVLYKEFVKQPVWEAGMRRLGRDGSWDRFDNVVVISEPALYVPDGISRLIDHARDTPHETRATLYDEYGIFDAGFIGVDDAGNREVGDLVVIMDVRGFHDALLLNTAVGALGASVLGVVLVVLFYRLAGRTEDIIARDQAALAEQEDLLRGIADSAKDAIILADNDARVSFWNEAAGEIFGYTAGEALGEPLHELLAPPDLKDAAGKGFAGFGQTGQGPVIGQTVELPALRKDGTEFPVELSISALRLHDRWHAVGIVRDITERKRTEEALRQAEKIQALGSLAGGAAHELNNLLLPIAALARMTLKDLPAEDRARVRLEKVVEAADRAAAIVKGITEFSRQEAAAKSEIDIAATVAEAIDVAATTLPKTVTLERELNGATGPVMADPVQIETAVLNMVSNSVEALEGATGILRIAVAPVEVDVDLAAAVPGLRAGRHARITVTDSGHGMDEDVLARAADPFFTTKEVGEGMGLGLSIAHGVATRHDGALVIASEPGEGTTVDIYVPIVAAEAD